MNGIHDVGGMHGLGPVPIDPKEPVFRAPWERDVFSVIGLYFAGGLCPLDEFRHSIETMDAAEYLVSKKVAAIGVDTLSPDSPQALRGKPIHPVILEKQILIVENLRNLEQLPDVFLFLALPLKIREGSGSPLRAVAMF